jgi:GTPase SAR1 family protein
MGGKLSGKKPAPAPAPPPKPTPAPAPAAAPAPAPAAAPSPPPEPEPAPKPKPKPTDPNAVDDDKAPAFGLLLCGAGESGKTTFTRQLKLKFLQNGISEADRQSFVGTMRGNLVESLQELLKWAETHDVDISPDVGEYAHLVCGANAFNCEFNSEMWDALQQLWEDPGVQTAFEHKDETVIPDHMDYFFGKLDDLREDDYVPTDEDILRARIRSIGIDSVTFSLDGAFIRIYDVGGQKSERGKWARVQEEIGGIIFCVSFADFDKPMFEELPKIVPRIHDALDIFADLTHQQKFLEFPFFFIANKFDSFTEKVQDSDCFLRVFPDYSGDPHDPQACAEYITQKFIERANPPLEARPIIVYQQSALDQEKVAQNATAICQYIRQHHFVEEE